MDFSLLGVKLSYFDTFIAECGEINLKGLSTTQVNENFLKPKTLSSGLSLCDQLKSQNSSEVGVSSWFISHAWKYEFLQVVESIRLFMQKEYGESSSQDVMVWFDLFSNSQHGTADRPYEWWMGTFKNAIGEMKNVLMVMLPWSEPVTMSRTWCIFELYCTEVTGSRFELSMTASENEKMCEGLRDPSSYYKMLGKLKSESSTCFLPEDREKIFSSIRKGVDGGFSTLDRTVFSMLDGWIVHQLRRRIEEAVHAERHIWEAVLSTVYLDRGKYNEAEILSRSSLASLESLLHSDHHDVIYSMHNLARLLQSMGKYSEAEPLFRSTFASYGRVLGSDHPYTLTVSSNLALLLQTMGKYDEAEPLSRSTLSSRERVLGPDHPNTINSMHNLACLLQSMGKYDQAEPLYRSTLASYGRVLGPDHPYTINSMCNLAGLMKSLDKYDEAEILSRSSLASHERVLGPDHPNTLNSMCNLANLLTSMGKYDEAEPLSRSTLSSRERVLGPDHPNTINSMHNLANLLRKLSKYDEAETLSHSTLGSYRRVLGPDHPQTISSMKNLATLLFSMGKYDEAELLSRSTLSSRERLLGPDDPDTLNSMCNLACVLHSMGKYDEAEPLYRSTLSSQERVLGPNHPDTLNSMINLGGLLQSMGKCDEAELLSRSTLSSRERVLGPDHPMTINSMINLANLLKSMGKYDEAEPLYRSTLSSQERVLGPDHPDTLKFMINLVNLLKSMGKLEDAKHLQEKYDEAESLSLSSRAKLSISSSYLDWKYSHSPVIPSSRYPDYPSCSNGHAMFVSSYNRGVYNSSNWSCDKCRKSSKSERWLCIHCTSDLCFDCIPKVSPTSSPTITETDRLILIMSVFQRCDPDAIGTAESFLAENGENVVDVLRDRFPVETHEVLQEIMPEIPELPPFSSLNLTNLFKSLGISEGRST